MITTESDSHSSRQSFGRPKDPAKRAGILCAATSLFMQHGYTLTSLEAVAKLADVSKLTIYSHFDNKAELFKAVIKEKCDETTGLANYLDFAKKPVEAGLLELGSSLATLTYSADSLHLQRTMYSEALQQPEVVKIFYEAGPFRVKTAFAELLREWTQQGQLEVEDALAATEQFFSLLKGERHNKAMLFLTPVLSQIEIDAHVSATVSVFLNIYRAKSIKGSA